MVWFQGYSSMTNPTFKQNVDNWQALNPAWKVSCLSGADLEKECARFSNKALDTYQKFSVMHQKIDFGRYVTLYNNGGIYVDMDAYVLRSLDSSPHVSDAIQRSATRHILGLSSIKIPPEAYLIEQEIGSSLNNGIMLSTRGNPLLGQYIEHIIALQSHTPSRDVDSTTGPREMRRFFRPYKNGTDQVVVFPPTVFEPCNADEKCDVRAHTVALHQFQLSWMPGWRKSSMIVYSHYRQLGVGILMGVIIVLVVMRITKTFSR